MNDLSRPSQEFVDALKSDDHAALLLKTYGEIKFVEWNGRLLTVAGQVLDWVALDPKTLGSLMTYAADSVIATLGKEEIDNSSDPVLLDRLKRELNVSAGKKKQYLYSARLALYIALCFHSPVSETVRSVLKLGEAWNNLTTVSYRKVLVDFVAKADKINQSSQPVQPTNSNPNPEVKLDPAPLRKPNPPATPEPTPAHITAYSDASVIMKKGSKGKGTTLAVYSPELQKGFIKSFPGVCLHIDQAEMLGIALAEECFPGVSMIYTDSKESVSMWEHWRTRRDGLTAVEPAAPLRPILFKNVQVSWIPREKNFIADYLAGWGNEVRQGWFRVNQRAPFNPNSESWIWVEKIIPKDQQASTSKGFSSQPTKTITVEKTVQVEVEKIVQAPATVQSAIDFLNQQIKEVEETACTRVDEVVEIIQQLEFLKAQEASKRQEAHDLMEQSFLLVEAKLALEGRSTKNAVQITAPAKSAIQDWIQESIDEELELRRKMDEPQQPLLPAEEHLQQPEPESKPQLKIVA
jgi:hypothetical protein